MSQQLRTPPRKAQVQQAETQVVPAAATHTLTGEEVDQLEQFKVKEGSVVWMMLGVSGVGKSCLSNFIFGQDNAFPESQNDLISETDKATLKCSSFNKKNLCVIDTPGLGDSENIGSHKSDAEDIAHDYSKLATELTKVMMMMDQGINAFLIVVPASHRDYRGLNALLDFCDIIGKYWIHSILVVTHGKNLGKNEKEQNAKFHATLAHPKGPPPLKKLLDRVSGRLVIVESKDWRNQPGYHCSVVGKIMKYSKKITEQHGPFKDELQSIGRAAFEKTKLQLRHKFEDMNSLEAQAAVFQSTFEHVRDVVHKLVRIKMADGEDVVKMKEMAAAREAELNEVSRQRDILRVEYEEQEKLRIEAEKILKETEDNLRVEYEEQEKLRIEAEKRLKETEDNLRLEAAARINTEYLYRENETARKEAEKEKKKADKKLQEERTKNIEEREREAEYIRKIHVDHKTAETAQEQTKKELQQEIERAKKAAEDVAHKGIIQLAAATENLRLSVIDQQREKHTDSDLQQQYLQRERELQATIAMHEKEKMDSLQKELEKEKESKGRLEAYTDRQRAKGFVRRLADVFSPPSPP